MYINIKRVKNSNFIIFGNITMAKRDMIIIQGQHYYLKIFQTFKNLFFDF